MPDICAAPAELVPPHARYIHQPVAPLIRSLYDHPLASASWQNHLASILSKELGGIEMPEQPSWFHFPSHESCPQCLRWRPDIEWSTEEPNQVLVHFAEACSTWGSRRAIKAAWKEIMSLVIRVLPFILQILQSSVSNSMNNCPARRSSTFAHLTAIAEPSSKLTISVLDSYQPLLQSLRWNLCGLVESVVQASWLLVIHLPETSLDGVPMMTSVPLV